MVNILNLKYAIKWEYQNIRIFLRKITLIVIKKLKTLYRVINDMNSEEIVGTFYKKKLLKTKQKEFGIEKVIKKGD